MPGKTVEETLPVFKDTVVIGNGPSAITLSYMLSGNVAYYSGQSDNDMLHKRMSFFENTPIVLQNLQELAQGLEGRSTNDVSLLFDALAHPDADTGIDKPSLLEWRQRDDLKSDHVVIGPDVPGGAWRQFGTKETEDESHNGSADDGVKKASSIMDKDVLTVSLGTWMELPNYSMSEWKNSKNNAELSSNERKTKDKSTRWRSGDRVSVAAVAEYYKDYVEKMGLSKNFLNRAIVTRVRKVSCSSLRCSANKRGQEGPGVNNCPQQVSAPKDRHNSETLFKFSEEDNILSESSGPEGGANEDETDSGLAHGGRMTSSEGSSLQSNVHRMATSLSSYDVTNSTDSSQTPLSSLSSSLATNSSRENAVAPRLQINSTSPIAAGGAVAQGASPSRSTCDSEDLDHFDENEELMGWETAPGEDAYALSRTPMGAILKLQAEANATHKCPIKRSSDYSSSVLTCTSWNPIVNPALFSAAASITQANAVHGLIESTLERTSGVGTSPMIEAQKILNSLPDHHHHHLRCPIIGGRRRHRLVSSSVTCPRDRPYLWEVTGQKSDGSQFKYLTQNVVMACGSDKPNKMDIPGENLPFVLHSLKQLEDALSSGALKRGDRVMVVGAGLSAADAVITSLENELKVLHMFRRGANDKNMIFKSLPQKMYPEYHRIHQMMARGREHEADYQPLERQHIIEIFEDKRVKFHGDVTTETVEVSHVVVLIGGRPNLAFFDELDGGVDPNSLGVVPNTRVSKNNPVDINIYTFESVKHPGLYAMGPLVGDNFVRFLQGGALAITSNILQQRKDRPIS